MQLTLEEFLVRIQLFQDAINSRLKAGGNPDDLLLAYATLIALIAELERTSKDLRETILPQLENGVRQRALNLVYQMEIKAKEKAKRRKK